MSAELWAIGIDLGATKLEMATVDQRGRLRQQSRISTPDVPEKVEGELARYILDATGDDDQKPAGIGVGVAGQISSDGMMIEFAPNLGWQKVPLGANLARRLDLPVRLLNDVRAATWGEWLYGAGRDCDNLACVFVGTGIGGGIISDGKMLDGHSNTAGEIGHMVVELNGEKCRCGNRGCLEAYAGGWGIARRARDACRDPVAGHLLLQLAGGDAGAVTAKTVSEAASAGDPLARRILSQADEALAAGMISLVHAFNPCRLVSAEASSRDDRN